MHGTDVQNIIRFVQPSAFRWKSAQRFLFGRCSALVNEMRNG